MTAESPIRVVVLTDGPAIRGWEAYILEEILRDDRFAVVGVVENTLVQPLLPRLLRKWRRLPWRLADALERALFRRLGRAQTVGGRDVDALVPLNGLLDDGVPRLGVTPLTGANGWVHRFPDADLERVRAFQADVMLRFGFAILRGGILDAARHGVWSFHHADNTVNRGGPPGFWEFHRGAPVTGAVLQRLGEDLDAGTVLRRAWYRTIPWSWNGNRRNVSARAAVLMADALKELARTRRLPAEAGPPPFAIYAHPLYVAPGGLTLLGAVLKAGWRITARMSQKLLTRERWRVYLGRGPLESASLRRFTPLIAPPDRFWADPFVVPGEDRVWVFVEEFMVAAGRGHISVLEVRDGTVVSVTPVVDAGCHASYPFLFRHGGRLFMVPETHAAGVVSLWECVDFPFRWERRRDLLTGVSAADTSLVEHEGRWWMFTNIERSGAGDHCDELHLFHTDDPVAGAWVPHAANPVVTDVRSARMGGGFLHRNGRLYRCAQASETAYGSAIVLAEVRELTPETYREEVCTRIGPTWEPGLFGTHHLAVAGDWIVVDAIARMRRFRMARTGAQGRSATARNDKSPA